MGQSLQKCSKISLVKKDDAGSYLSVYTDAQTIEGVVMAVARLKQAFPSLEKGFYNILTDRVKEKGLTDAQIMDSVNHVIDTCEYPTPVIGKFLSWDKKRDLLTYNDMCKLAQESSGAIWKSYDIIENKGVKFWAKKQQI